MKGRDCMIFYFSGTGNSKWIAEKIGEKIGSKIYDISKEEKIPDCSKEQYVGLVFPVYAWGVPEPMEAFTKKLRKTEAFTFGVATCGADAGFSLKKLSKIYSLQSCYSISMPNNYIIGSDIEDSLTIKEKIEKARQEIQRITDEILQKHPMYRVQEGAFPFLKSTMIHAGFQKFARTTKPFYVTEQCNGCGMCEKNCPASTIILVHGKPQWKEKCFQCLRCINECPQIAIQYGKETETRGRYTIDKYLK